MEPESLTVEILKSIRDEMRGANQRLDRLEQTTNDRFESLEQTTNDRFESLEQTTNNRFERLEKRQVALETRLATELMAVAGAVGEVRDLLRETSDLRPKIEDHEQRLVALEERRGA